MITMNIFIFTILIYVLIFTAVKMNEVVFTDMNTNMALFTMFPDIHAPKNLYDSAYRYECGYIHIIL